MFVYDGKSQICQGITWGYLHELGSPVFKSLQAVLAIAKHHQSSSNKMYHKMGPEKLGWDTVDVLMKLGNPPNTLVMGSGWTCHILAMYLPQVLVKLELPSGKLTQLLKMGMCI